MRAPRVAHGTLLDLGTFRVTGDRMRIADPWYFDSAPRSALVSTLAPLIIPMTRGVYRISSFAAYDTASSHRLLDVCIEPAGSGTISGGGRRDLVYFDVTSIAVDSSCIAIVDDIARGEVRHALATFARRHLAGDDLAEHARALRGHGVILDTGGTVGDVHLVRAAFDPAGSAVALAIAFTAEAYARENSAEIA